MQRYHFVSIVVSAFLSTLVPLTLVCAQDSVPNLRYGRWGFDLAAADLSARPGDEFFTHANGAWLATLKFLQTRTG